MTHAFFKALLFLGAGSVIHALSDEQDMRRMGGLADRLPWTHGTMLIGDARDRRHPAVRRVLQQGRDPRTARSRAGTTASGRRAWWAPVLTAFYMFRLYILAFRGALAPDATRPSTTCTSRRRR